MIDKNQYHDYLEEFIDLYSKRPFKVNRNGMRFNHSFGIYCILKIKKPELVIESGVDRGHSTWLIENTIDTQIVCIDPKPHNIIYKAKDGIYFEDDFVGIDWTKFNINNSICIFDDHQNAYSRLMEMKWWGFKSAIFEDNFPTGEGDSYSIKQVLDESGHERIQLSEGFQQSTLRGKLMRYVEEKVLLKNYWRQNIIRKSNKIDKIALGLNLNEYFEIPPIFVNELNHFNKDWSGKYEINSKPLFENLEDIPKIEKILNDIPKDQLINEFSYCYISFLRLN